MQTQEHKTCPILTLKTIEILFPAFWLKQLKNNIFVATHTLYT